MRILTINSGSSSLKSALYEMAQEENLILSAHIRGIGSGDSSLRIEQSGAKTAVEQELIAADWSSSVRALMDWLNDHDYLNDVDAVGHRVVHGGAEYTRPHLVTEDLIKALHALVPFAPDHLPQEVSVIETIRRHQPNLRQVVCFDTSFHRDMPRLAQIYALPRFLTGEGMIRYGFHGLSYEYIVEQLRNEAGDKAAQSRIIIAHLGSGASMAAVNRGKSIDTTMGFTPTGGLVMSTRCGDLDPGVILYLLREKKLSADAVSDMVNRRAGLLGVSGLSPDMKELLDNEAEHPDAREAVGLFCCQARKFLGALAAVLGGLDVLVFTGGIGENSAAIRERICSNMQFLGISLDSERNNENASIISGPHSAVTVRVMKTNEELVVARHSRKCIETVRTA